MIEDPASLRFFMTEHIFLTKNDAEAIVNGELQSADSEPVTAVHEPVVQPQANVLPAVPPTPVAIPSSPAAQPQVTPPVVADAGPVFNYIGKNQKNFLIAFYAGGAGQLAPKHFEALSNTLQRKGLSVDDVAMVDIGAYPNATIAQIGAYFAPARVLILGSQSLLPGWDRLKLNIITQGSKYAALYTYSFDEMMGDKDKVKAFWEQMKNL